MTMTGEHLAIYPAPGGVLGLRSLLRNGMALLTALWSRPSIAHGYFTRGEGRIVLVIPAFLAGDWATARLRRFLDELGYRTQTAGVLVNLGPTTRLIAMLDAALLRLSAEGPIDVIGQSLGGVLARDLVRRNPARVRRLVTLCSPIRIPITTPLAPAARLLERFLDSDWLARRVETVGPLGVPVIALYSEDDGVVDWRECLQEEHAGCANVRVAGAHATIGSSASALAAIAHALSS